MSTGCGVCNDKVARRAVDEELDRGGTGAYVARLMTARGFPMSDQLVNRHKRENHRSDYEKEAPPSRKESRDAAKLLKDKTLDMIEAGDVDLKTREGMGVAKIALQAQGLEDKRERSRPKQTIFLTLAQGLVREHLLLDDGNTIEGEVVDVTDDGDG